VGNREEPVVIGIFRDCLGGKGRKKEKFRFLMRVRGKRGKIRVLRLMRLALPLAQKGDITPGLMFCAKAVRRRPKVGGTTVCNFFLIRGKGREQLYSICRRSSSKKKGGKNIIAVLVSLKCSASLRGKGGGKRVFSDSSYVDGR